MFKHQKYSLLPQCETPIGNNSGSVENESHDICLKNGVFGYGGSNGVTSIFIT